MHLQNELGRHTHPPPPYSLSKRGTPKIEPAKDASQRPNPPPPPPYLTNTPKSDCSLPPIDGLRRQTVASDDPYLSHLGNAISLPPVSSQRSAAHNVGPQNGFPDCPGNWNYTRNCPETPAHPVEPKWTPVGILGYPGPLSMGATAPLPKFLRERIDHSTPQSFVCNAGTRIRADDNDCASQSSNIAVLGPYAASCATRPPIHTLKVLPTMILKSQRNFRRPSSKETASLANIITNDTTRAFRPYETICPPSALPYQQVIERRATLTNASTTQDLKATEKVADLKSLLGANEDINSDGEPSDGDRESTHAGKVPMGQDSASLSRIEHEHRPSKDGKTSRGRDGGHPASRSSHRRPSAPARFEPYQRPQSNMADRIRQRPGCEVDEGCAKSPGTQ